jgi:hypothetical protein
VFEFSDDDTALEQIETGQKTLLGADRIPKKASSDRKVKPIVERAKIIIDTLVKLMNNKSITDDEKKEIRLYGSNVLPSIFGLPDRKETLPDEVIPDEHLTPLNDDMPLVYQHDEKVIQA